MTPISACGFYVLRRAVLPVATLESVHRQPGREGVYAQLRAVFADPAWQEALYVASPDFYAQCMAWLAGKPADDADRIALTLYKYLVRMCTRCTPYGLFAGCATGTVADRTEIRFDPVNPYRKRSRLDMEVLTGLVDSLLASGSVQAGMRYRPNGMLYEVNNEYRYTERLHEDNQQSFRISSIEKSDYLDAVLRTAAGGATRRDLAECLLDHGVELAEGYGFVDDLIGVQVLVAGLSPTLTGEDFATVLGRRIRAGHPEHAPVAAALAQAGALLARQDTGVEKYHRVAALARHAGAPASPHAVQVDLFYNTPVNTLGRAAVHRITRQLEKLTGLARRHESDELAAFKKRFCDRYEQQEVPLHVALDDELGVGYSLSSHHIGFQPLLEEIDWPEPGGRKAMAWNAWHALACRKYEEALETRQPVTRLTDADLAALNGEAPAVPLPGSLYAFGNLLAGSAADVDGNRFLFNLIGCAGPSSAALLGRFCTGDPELSRLVKQALAEEESRFPGAVFAEVVHLPEARMGNVLRRPHLRDYEIPYLTDSTLDEDHCLPISDLRVSVRDGGRIVLRSVKLNKEVIPRLSSAHNFRNGLPIYRFLCDLQCQDAGMALGWDWGPLADQAFLPRVQYENVIVSRATWHVTPPAPGVDMSRWVADLKDRHHLPQYVVIVQGDNELLIDTHHAFSLALLQAELAKRGRLTLKEYLFTPGNRFVTDEQGGGYANEIVLPLKTVAPAKPTALLPADPAGGVRRKFPLGSEWLFVKIYAGEKITETLLLQCIRPLVRQLEAEGLIDQWFFVRYADPEPHLRLRFHGAADPHFFVRIIAAINAIGEAYVQNHVILRVQYDTYNREVERYGEKTIAHCEELFHCDSEAVLDLIEPFAADDGAERQRWLVGLRGVDELLNDAGYSLDDKLLLMDGLQQRFLAEFGDGPDLGRQLNQKYRQESAAIGEALGGGTGGALGFFLPVFGRRSEKQAPLLRTIRDVYGPQTLQMLVPSFVHMYLNRLFFANQRAYELVIYHFLRKHYASTLARRKPAV